MASYVDSGILIKLYVREANSHAAIRAIAPRAAIPLNPLQELEIRNTLRALEGRSTITSAQRAASEHELERDITVGRLLRAIPDWQRVYALATRLSAEHASDTLARSLDILHVAIAISDQADSFVTGDRRQLAVAERSGLSTTLVA